MPKRLAVFIVAIAALAAPAAAHASDVIVQGTTDVRDAGLLDDVIAPGFKAAYPQYTLKYVAVGTGQALTNAQAGQGDAVLTHAPTLESTFVANGFSDERFGRAIFYSDYVILGPKNDPAGVLSGAAHNSAQAFQLIAAAGAAGKANFVSRGDNSGTNVEEKAIWQLTTGVPLIASGQDGRRARHRHGERPPGTRRRAAVRPRRLRSPTSARSPAAAATRSPTAARSTASSRRTRSATCRSSRTRTPPPLPVASTCW